LSVVSFTSFLASFLVARACFLALRTFSSRDASPCRCRCRCAARPFALSVALAAVVLGVFTLSLSANAGSAKLMASGRDHPFNMFSFPFAGRPIGPAVLRKVRTRRSLHNGPEDHQPLEAAYRSFGWLPEGAVSTGFCVSVGWPVTSPGRDDMPGSLLAPLSSVVLGAGGRATLPGVP